MRGASGPLYGLLATLLLVLSPLLSGRSRSTPKPALAPPSVNSMPGLAQHWRSCQNTSPHLLVDTHSNRFYLFEHEHRLKRQGPCSTGSGREMSNPKGGSWTFHTPRGRHVIQYKTRNPVWRKPDWAYLEEGDPVPQPDSADRFESGMLGPCALDLGSGYLIHGAPYRRLIGDKNTHGCVRLLDEDLESVYASLSTGCEVWIQ